MNNPHSYPVILVILFCFSIIENAYTQNQSTNISGTWEGVMTHGNDGYSPTWQLVLTFEQRNNQVKGTTKIIARDQYATFSLTGNVANNVISTVEGAIVEENSIKMSGGWCMARVMKLRLLSQNKLEGVWSSPTENCTTGKITAYRTSEPTPVIVKAEEKTLIIKSVISGQIIDKQTLEPVKTVLSIVGEKSSRQAIPTSNDGFYEYKAPINDISIISISADGYEPLRESINIDKSTLIKNFFLVPKTPFIEPKKDEPVVLKNVLFNEALATLLPQSFPELDRLVTLMQTKSTIKIRLEGHTDRIGDAGENLKLSQDRVVTVKRYLTKKGISEMRIDTKGYGDTKPICTPPKKGEPCEANRRVEFVVTE